MPAGRKLKYTFAGRFEQLDCAIVQEIDRRFPQNKTIRVHDIAASSAVTSVELFEKISDVRSVNMYASDYYDAVLSVRLHGMDLIFDVDGNRLQIAFGVLAVPATNRLVERLAASLWVRAAAMLPKAERISLFHPNAIKLAGKNPRFTLGREDIFRLGPDRYDVVRVLNLLGPDFTPEQNSEIVAAVVGTIEDGGLFISGWGNQFDIWVVNDGQLGRATNS